jgi:uncharacterized protein
MSKRVFIIHGWDGYPEEGWFPWLKRELEACNFEVQVPQMPQPGEPRINNWIPELQKIVSNPDEQTYFVGHSMGCQAIARYLESLPGNVRIGGVIFVAGFFKRLTNLEDDDTVRSVSKEWLETPISLEKIKTHINKSVAIFSDDDPYVPVDNREEFENVLGSKIIIEHNKGHFSGSTGITKLPIALKAILDISKEDK